MNKYLNYRERLLEKFVVSQPAYFDLPGTNLPANGYNARDSGVYARKLSFGDATVDLGYYIGILATEYYLRKSNNLSTSQVEEELYRAIYTVYRLDRYAERFFDYDENSNSLNLNNGFFLRDDVHGDFVTYWAQHGYPYFSSQHLENGVKSDYTNGVNFNEMSEVRFGDFT